MGVIKDRKSEHEVVWTHCVSVDNLSNGDVDDRFGDSDQVRVLIHIELIFKWGNVTRCQEETPVMGRQKDKVRRDKQLKATFEND